MCRTCYEGYVGDSPPEMTPRMFETVELIEHLYSFPWGRTGGPLHVELDDMNLADRYFDADHRTKLVYHGDGRGTVTANYDHRSLYRRLATEDWDLCLAIFDRLAEMTPAQRAETVWRADPW